MSPAEFVRLEPLYRATLAGASRTDEQSQPRAPRASGGSGPRPLRTPSGKVYAGLAVATDVTDRRVEELRRLRIDAQLERARRLEAVGKMAGGVAHDFNNLLAVVLNYTDFIADALPGDSELQEDLAEIRRAGERGASLTRQLLIFSRREVATPEMIDLNDVDRRTSRSSSSAPWARTSKLDDHQGREPLSRRGGRRPRWSRPWSGWR